MKIEVSEVLELFALLSEKTGEPTDYAGLRIMANNIGDDVSHRYLDNKWREVKNGDEEIVTINDVKLEAMLEYLGFRSYKDFKLFIVNPIHEVLKSCEGNWINYVRQNSANGYVLVSPVSIAQEGQKMTFYLKGPDFDYKGNIEFRIGSLFCQFSNENGKQFHHVYKIGNRKSPKVLQGVFSGVSTSNEPIAGRTVLIKTEDDLDKIENSKFSIEKLIHSKEDLDQAIGTYFKSFDDNNLALNRVITYGFEDLLG